MDSIQDAKYDIPFEFYRLICWLVPADPNYMGIIDKKSFNLVEGLK